VRFLASPEGTAAGYGYTAAGLAIDDLCAEQFTRLAELEMTYLDGAGAGLYAADQIDAVAADLKAHVFANPHSGSAMVEALQRSAANTTAAIVASVRAQIASFLCTTLANHSVVFNSGSTAAIKMVGETFAWSKGSVLCYLYHSHTSCVGLREYAYGAGAAAVENVNTADEFLAIAERSIVADPEAQHLLVVPLQCNFSGTIYSLSFLDKLRELQERKGLVGEKRRWRVLLDAAAYVSHARLDLSRITADFVPISWYKLFGYPTGIGCLIVRNDAVNALVGGKRYFGGGTVSACIQQQRYHIRREGISEWFEDGTLPFLQIAALRHGFAAIDRVGGIEAIDKHTCCLARYLADKLSALRHGNGQPVCVVAERATTDVPAGRGPVVSFNVRKANGSWVGPSSVGTLAALAGIQIRTGCMCNPSACHAFLGLTPEGVLANVAAGKVCWSDDMDLLSDKPTGAVRASIAYITRFEDVDRLISFLTEYFLEADAGGPWPATPPNPTAVATADDHYPLTVSRVLVYPVKSCNGMLVDSWEFTSTGALLYDREWAVLGIDSKPLTQKTNPKLSWVVPSIDLAR
jgi:molybdenum cofactor sulfurtransferase